MAVLDPNIRLKTRFNTLQKTDKRGSSPTAYSNGALHKISTSNKC